MSPSPLSTIPRFRGRRASGALITLLLATACGPGGDDPAAIEEARSSRLRAQPTVAAEDARARARDGVSFALGLTKHLREAPENQVLSPVSVILAMGMTSGGARGATADQLARALSFSLPQDRLHPALNDLEAQLRARGEGKKGSDGGALRLHLVNRLWAQKGYQVEPAYLDLLAESYGAGVGLLDFSGQTDGARRAINAWVADRTEKRIQDLLPEGAITPNTRLVLTNAVYFNAAWKTPFPQMATNDGDFKRRDGSTVRVPFMRLESELRAGTGPGFTAVALPYDDDRLEMLLAVPDATAGAAFEESLDAAAYETIDRALAPRRVVLSLPRFRFEAAFRLKEALSAMGMPGAFVNGQADLSGMNGGREPLFIQDVIHKAFIAVGEKGTEAAAATAVPVAGRSAPPQDTLYVSADRPFFFWVRDVPTGAILFAGRVRDPSLR